MASSNIYEGFHISSTSLISYLIKNSTPPSDMTKFTVIYDICTTQCANLKLQIANVDRNDRKTI